MTTTRERIFRPAPHVFVHVENGVHWVTLQSTLHWWLLHAAAFSSAGQALPPWAAAVATRRVHEIEKMPPPQGFEHVPHHTFMGSPEYLGEAGAGAGAGVEAGAGADPARRPSEAQEGEGGGAGRAGWRLDDFDPYERGEAGCVPLLRGDFYKLINVAVYENAVGSRSRVGVLAGGRVRFGVLEGRG